MNAPERSGRLKRTVTSALAAPSALTRVVITQREVLERTGAPLALLLRLERAGLVQAVGRSPRERFFLLETVDRVERVQELLAAGYSEQDVAHVGGRLVPVRPTARQAGALDAVVELPLARPEMQRLAEAGQLPLWGVTAAGAPLIHAADVPLCEALVALSEVGLEALAPALAEAAVGGHGLVDVAAAIDERLTSLQEASSRLRKALGQLERRARPPRERLRRLLRPTRR